MHLGWPIGLFNILAMILANVNMPRNLHCVEYFSGVAVIAAAFQAAGLNARTYDIMADSIHENLNTPEGLCQALMLALNMLRGGVCHFATVCSTWVFMSLASTKRTAQ